jgi:hypothetical protein
MAIAPRSTKVNFVEHIPSRSQFQCAPRASPKQGIGIAAARGSTIRSYRDQAVLIMPD